jgi:P2 family phage contractile tail tube protein
MALISLPRQLKNFNLYVDGESFAGKADTITLPALNLVVEKHRAGGMDAPRGIELGMEELKLSFVISDLGPQMISLLGKDGVAVVARGSVQAQGSDAEPVVINMRGLFRGLESSAWTLGAKSSRTVNVDLSYFRYRQKDVEYCEIDIDNMIRTIGGVDQLAAHRTNIGL